jgi:hypothetical protein
MGKSNKKKTTQEDSLKDSQSSTGFYNFEDCIDYDVNYYLKRKKRVKKGLQKRVQKVREE